jgi:hypothetical protein
VIREYHLNKGKNNMNYMKIYNDLVSHAKSQILPTDTYVERHHIIMKSLGGSNDKSNLVTFTAR